ncbi:MAG: biotin--[acetyl-CoA-carboxylase] ligase [Terrisporobacter sp.]|uniref:biotin--[acetyl-CoA-carboxylase] ligase n=1 Tax=Terrisporobacter sp. TaxID=1965305 RepID=UPI002FC6425D
MRNKIIKVILNSGQEFISGEELSNELGISRTAVWKHIKKLKEEGYEIESVNKKGYRLVDFPGDVLNLENINHSLNTKHIGKNIIHLSTIDSTNDYLKRIGNQENHGTVVISEEQTKGKGRLGRQWESSAGEGIWMSILLKPDMVPYKAPFITLITGVAIVNALSKLNINVNIKWPNDIIINNKKICGILTELSAEIERINYIVVGVGINVKNMNFPSDLDKKATSLYKEKYIVSRVDIVKGILDEFENLYDDYIENNNKETVLDLCRQYSNIINKEVYMIKGEEKELVTCIDINNEGNLLVKDSEGQIKEIISGEVSIRGIKGYI